MIRPTFHLRSLSATLLVLLCAGHPVLADDTEVLIGPGGQAWAKPNVLFIMDTSGSMGTNIAGGVATAADPSRLSIVQGVFADLMNTNSGFNVALMRFDASGNGGYFVTPMQELNDSTRSSIITASNNLSDGGNTPLSETLYEAARYYGGLTVDYGDSSTPGINHADVFSGNNYDSPITSQCQANYIVLLTDGEPTSDTNANDNIRDNFLNGTACTNNCLDEVAGYLHTADQNSTIPDTQTVETYTIGFTTNQALLQDTATAGGGAYITANNAQDLSAAFATILDTITDTNDSFSPPALAANSFSGVSHHNRLHFALFEPAAAPQWPGNVKPYAIDDNFQLVDADNQPAVDTRGFFVDTSRSFWSNSDDGDSIAAGGANGQLPAAASRKLYTYTSGYSSSGVPDVPALSAATNALKNDIASNLTAAMLGLSNPDATALEAEFTSVLDTIRASKIGAPLHSQPAMVTYGGTEASPDLTLFVATNDGFLHALNAGSGVEQFAFIPKELLPNLPTLTRNTGSHPHGLDGDISVWVKESNDDDQTIEATEGDHVFVYVGMRRGGNNYYALDVTNRDAPTLKWVIQGGAGGTPGFEELGQSWSRPTLTSIQYGASSKKVLIFAGGYDTAQDANPLNADDSIGRAIFVVDADTGSRLWWAGPAGSAADVELATLTNSIPSEVRLLDSNLDGHTDRLYVGDMRGQLFRFDLAATASSMTGTGVRLANLGGNTEADNRRFYYPPDAVVTRHQGTYVSLNIGSGYRAHPLNPLNPNGTAGPRVNDRFYSLRDPYVVSPVPDPYTSLTHGNLFDATSSLVTSPADIASLASASGWYLTLGSGNGEKVLAPAITINGEVFFTTYTPPTSVALSSCAPPPGTGSLYRVSLFNASPVIDVNADGDLDDLTDRSLDLPRPGIPPAPAAVFHKNSSGKVELGLCVGTDCEEMPNAIQMQETYWTDGS
ncbi:MAG: PilC/PilY family type IV pilus protein [Gammaproteobacteria bacterium]|nr:PilC/PilY family type IV pilus protein [Gammaproteobacteria bacterium]